MGGKRVSKFIINVNHRKILDGTAGKLDIDEMTNEKSLGPIIADRNMLKVKKILPNLSINMNLTYNGFISKVGSFGVLDMLDITQP
ncbi:hypothetical protein RIR_jg7188.t1 [Rhizophagus irregularis DAOM 181602=DAOM 197198]|nr:hypothetical protein RIR_jg7188.t1 [Rhizophagus irregularis DAOM 181602=DAOM 197198]